MTNNKMKIGIAMMLIASLSASALLIIPSKFAIAQTPSQNQTMPSGNLTKVTKVVVPVMGKVIKRPDRITTSIACFYH